MQMAVETEQDQMRWRTWDDVNHVTRQNNIERPEDDKVFDCQQFSHSPVTQLVSGDGCAPKAHIHWELPGTWNLQKLHLELKYLGRNDADARLEWREKPWEQTLMYLRSVTIILHMMTVGEKTQCIVSTHWILGATFLVTISNCGCWSLNDALRKYSNYKQSIQIINKTLRL